eukprot:4589368-Alexandrium_andersonii.AAC.1
MQGAGQCESKHESGGKDTRAQVSAGERGDSRGSTRVPEMQRMKKESAGLHRIAQESGNTWNGAQ